MICEPRLTPGFLVASFAAIAAICGNPAQADSFLDQFPYTSSTRLSNGTPISFPAKIREENYLALSGVADLKALTAALAPQGVAPVEAQPGSGLGVVNLYMIQYADSDFGPYNEEFVGVLVAPKDPTQPKMTIFPNDVSVDHRVPLLGGREIWGYPKRLARIQFNAIPHGDIDASMTEKNSAKPSVHVVCHDCMNLPTQAVPFQFDVVTPKTIKQTWSSVSLQTHLASRPFDRTAGDAYDSLDSDGSPATSFLSTIHFQPTTWMIGLNTEAVLFR